MIATIALLVATAVVALLAGTYRYAKLAQAADERFDSLLAPSAAGGGQVEQAPRLRDRLEARLSSASFGSRTRNTLARANAKLTLTEYLLLRLGVTVIGFLLGWALSRSALFGAVVAIPASAVPNAYLSRRIAKRAKAFEDQLPDMLSLVVNALRSGHGLLQAVSLVSAEMPEPTCQEFGRVRRELNLGYSMSEALRGMVKRIDSDDLELMVTAINVQYEVGGNLAEILETIGDVIRDRIRILCEVRAMSAQQRLVGTVLSGLPFLLGAVLMMINPEYMRGLFQPGLPMMLGIGATVMVIVGYVIMQKLLDLDV